MGKKKKKKKMYAQKVQAPSLAVDSEISPRKTSHLLTVVFCIVVFLAGFGVYANTLSSDFIWDDEYLILNNSQIKDFSHIPNVFKTYVGYGSENINNFYRPVQELANMIDYGLWGPEPFGFHLTNTLLHAIVGVLVLLLVFALSKNLLAAFFAALFYTIHPVHTEAIAYIAGRADSLYSIFAYVSLLFYIRSVSTTNSAKRTQLYSLSIITFVISLLAKEMIIVMPILIFMYTFFFFRGTQNNPTYIREKRKWIPYAVIVVGYGFLRSTVLDFSKIAPASAFEKIVFPYRILTFSRAVMEYFRLMILPVDLHMERVIRITRTLFDVESILAVLVLVGVGYIAYRTYHSGKRLISFSIAWFFAVLLPVSNIVPINNFVAEHWIYMAAVGPFLLLGLGLAWLWNNIPANGRSLKIGFVLFLAFILSIYANLTITKNRDWKTEESFFRSTLKYNPNNARLYLNLGNTYYENKQIDKAVEQYENAIKINKNYAVAYGNIGSTYMHVNDYDKAEEYLIKALSIKDNYPIAHYNLGIIYYRKNNFPEAKKELELAVSQLPQLYQAWNMLGRTYIKLGNLNEATNAFNTSLSISPNQPPARKTLSKINEIRAKLGKQ